MTTVTKVKNQLSYERVNTREYAAWLQDTYVTDI